MAHIRYNYGFKNYLEFNQEIYQVFFANNLYSNNHVAVVFADIAAIEKFSGFKDACTFLGSKSWNDLNITSCNGIPNYLGLVAIQIFALSLRMSDIQKHPQGAYNPQLCTLLEISGNKLQDYYKNAQISIFEKFEKWCKHNGIGIRYFLKGQKGKYVCYPLSFPILNAAERVKLERRFAKLELPVDGSCKPSDFRTKLSCSIKEILPVFNTAIEDEVLEALWHQIYLLYKDWDGSYQPDDSFGEHKRKKLNKRNTAKEYSIEWDGSEGSEVCFYPGKEEIKELLLRKENKELGCFFRKDPNFTSYWEFVRPKDIDLDADDDEIRYAYICKTETQISQKLSTPFFKVDEELQITVVDKIIIKALQESDGRLWGRKPAISLRDGIKVEPWSRKWMEGAGPRVIPLNGFGSTNTDRVTLINGEKRVTYSIEDVSLTDLPCGYYKLRYSPDPDDIIDFEICNIEKHRCLSFGNGGWKFDDKKQLLIAGEDDPVHICGLDFSQIPEELLRDSQLKKGTPCRIWMDLAATGKSPEYSNENLIHKSLRRAKNGCK